MSKPIIPVTPRGMFEGTEQQLGVRERSYFVRCYHSIDKLRDMFQYCEHFAFVVHDKDDKAIHNHFIVRYRDALTPTAFAKKLQRLDPTQSFHFSVLRDKYSAFDYLQHCDEKSIEAGKHRYEVTEILTDDLAYFTRGQAEIKAKERNDDFFDDLLNGSLTRREMALKYGRDYAKNFRVYDQFAKEVYAEEYRATLPQDDLDKLNNSAVDIAGIVWQIMYKYAPRLMKGCNVPSYNLLQQEVDIILQEMKIGE